MPDISTAHLVGSTDRDTTTARLRTEVPLLLYDNDDAIACEVLVRMMVMGK